MGIYDTLPKGSQVKLWDCDLGVKRKGDTVPDLGLGEYIVLLREGGYVKVVKCIIAKIVEGKKKYYPEDFPTLTCFDKWGAQVASREDLTGCGIMGENYYWREGK